MDRQGVKTDVLVLFAFLYYIKLMKKENRLKLNKDFRRLYAKGKSTVYGCVVVYAMKNKRGTVRIGLTVGKGVGNAVKRNRAKRLLRVAADEAMPNLAPGYDLIFVARNRIDGKKSGQVSHDLLKALKNLRLIED